MVAAVFHRLFTLRQRRPTTKIRKRRRTFPQVEQLEDRVLLAAPLGGHYLLNFHSSDPTLYSPDTPLTLAPVPNGFATNPIPGADWATLITSLAPDDLTLGQIIPFMVLVEADAGSAAERVTLVTLFPETYSSQ